MSRPEVAIKVLYEDNHLLALFKPAGMLVQGDRSGDPSLLEWARDWIRVKYRKPGRVFTGLVHRLDRPVPGVVILARTSKAARRLSEQFRNHQVEKIYWAVIRGRLSPESGEAHVYLAKRGMRAVTTSPEDAAGKKARLSYRTLRRESDFTLIEITLVTGRHHQIRAQLAALGYPIIGDRRYGSFDSMPSGAIALLAKRLTCRHPTRPMEITFEAPLPESWPWSLFGNRVLN